MNILVWWSFSLQASFVPKLTLYYERKINEELNKCVVKSVSSLYSQVSAELSFQPKVRFVQLIFKQYVITYKINFPKKISLS